MSLTRSYLVTFLFYISIVNQIRLPLVKCQDEESVRCIPKRALLALSRLPEIGFNLAAYSRTARVIQDAKTRNDMAHLKALAEEGDDDTEICIPAGIYSVLFKDPAMRGHLFGAAIGGAQNLPDVSGRFLEDDEEIDAGGMLQPNFQKRSIAMLAKNDDLPISLQDRLEENQDDEEKRTMVSSDEPSVPSTPRILPRPVLDSEGYAPDYTIDKRNVGTLARDFALPPGRRNMASLVRDYELQGRENNDDYMAGQFPGKRNVASLARGYTLPQNGKRNVGAVARDFGLPYGKRNLGSLARTGDYPTREHGKRSVSSLAKNRAWPISLKRGISVPTSVILRTVSRQGRSLADELKARNDLSNLQELASVLSQKNYDGDGFGDDKLNDSQTIDALYGRINSANRRPNKQVSFSDEYPLPVMQNTNGFDYEEMMEALGDQYLNAEKRFMGRIPQMGRRPTPPPPRQQGL